jgi:hypothetical protein
VSAEWRETGVTVPPEQELVDTKIHDQKGCRNEQPLQRIGNLWWFADGNMYVYYTPTHWKPRYQVQRKD